MHRADHFEDRIAERGLSRDDIAKTVDAGTEIEDSEPTVRKFTRVEDGIRFAVVIDSTIGGYDWSEIDPNTERYSLVTAWASVENEDIARSDESRWSDNFVLMTKRSDERYEQRTGRNAGLIQ